MYIDGARYEWLHHPDEVPLAELPAWVFQTRVASRGSSRGEESSSGILYLHHFDSEKGDIRTLLQEAEVVKACMRQLSIPETIGIGDTFKCILPGHGEEHPSAVIYPYQKGDGVHSYLDLHHQVRKCTKIHPLGAVRAYQAYGEIKSLGKPELTTWSLRLLCESKVLKPESIRLESLPPDAPTYVQKVYEGYCYLLAVKWLHSPNQPTPFTWRFASAWCGVSQRTAGEAIKWLLAHGYLIASGQHGNTTLFLPR